MSMTCDIVSILMEEWLINCLHLVVFVISKRGHLFVLYGYQFCLSLWFWKWSDCMVFFASQLCSVAHAPIEYGGSWVRCPIGWNQGQWNYYLLQTALMSKNNGRLAQSQDNTSEWSDMSTIGQLFQWASTIKIRKCMFV